MTEPLSTVVERQERELVSFLQIGFDRDHDLYIKKNELYDIYGCLKQRPAVGYALSMNNTAFYQLSFCEDPNYAGAAYHSTYQEGHS